MILRFGDSVFDYDLELLKDVLEPIDANLVATCEAAATASDPDSFGYFDRAEHVTGLGFVACQAYMTATFSTLKVAKRAALDAGPLHKCGRTITSIVNHAANYWKHSAEWMFGDHDARRERILEAFDDIGFAVGTDYPLCGVLAELTTPQDARFEPLIPGLVVWRDALLRISREES